MRIRNSTQTDPISPGSSALDQLNTMVVRTRHSGDREFRLLRGDITKLNFPVDLMIISAIGSDFTPTSTSVIGALYQNHQILVERLSEDPEFTLAQPRRVWVSREIGGSSIRRIMCVEIPPSGRGANRIVEDAFFTLPLLEARQLQLSTICLPILGTGDRQLAPQQTAVTAAMGSRL